MLKILQTFTKFIVETFTYIYFLKLDKILYILEILELRIFRFWGYVQDVVSSTFSQKCYKYVNNTK